MILGTLMIGLVVNVIKESEMDTLVTPLVNAWVAYLLAVQWPTATVEDDKVTPKVLDPTEYDELVITEDSKMIDAFSSKIIHTRMKTAFTGPMCWRGVIAPRFDATKCLHWDAQWQQKCCCHGEKWYGILSDLEEEDPSGNSGSCQLGAWATHVAWHDRCIGWGPRHPNTEDDHRAKAGKAVWEVQTWVAWDLGCQSWQILLVCFLLSTTTFSP